MNNFGGLGNRMVRYMLAQRIAAELGGWPVVGHQMPEWGLVSDQPDQPQGRGFSTGRAHRQDVAGIARRALAEQVDHVLVESFGQRLEYFADQRARFAALFAGPPGNPIADDELAINIRTGDIVDGYHPDYTPLPLAFYHRLVFETGLRPVFVGQLQDNWYNRALRAQFPQARFLSGGVIEDFQTVRGARHVVPAISSFSWLAAWLSDRAEVIHLPVAGLFNPLQRGDIDLLPRDDPRWRFHLFVPGRYEGADGQKAILASRPTWVQVGRAHGGGAQVGEAQASGEGASFLGYRQAQQNPAVLGPAQAAAMLTQAVRQREPFLFTQLDDGDPALHGPLDRADLIALRDDAWLADARLDNLSEDDPAFLHRFRIHFPLRDQDRAQIDEHAARRIWRLFDWARRHYPRHVPACSRWAFQALSRGHFWRDLLAPLPRINVIDCSPALVAHIEARMGVPVRNMGWPGGGGEQAQGCCAGEVFLLGAGLGGTGCGAAIKQAGGVAFDIGTWPSTP